MARSQCLFGDDGPFSMITGRIVWSAKWPLRRIASGNCSKLGDATARSVLVLAALLVPGGVGVPSAGETGSEPAEPAIGARLEHLVAVYPDYLKRIESGDLVWTDGTRMAVDDHLGGKALAVRLDNADIKDMLSDPYPLGPAGIPPGAEADPGRARNAAFFDKMYGDCTQGQTQRSLETIVWLPKKWGGKLQITARNGVADKLTAVSRNTLKEHFRQLVDKGYLSKQGGGRSTWYVLSRYV